RDPILTLVFDDIGDGEQLSLQNISTSIIDETDSSQNINQELSVATDLSAIVLLAEQKRDQFTGESRALLFSKIAELFDGLIISNEAVKMIQTTSENLLTPQHINELSPHELAHIIRAVASLAINNQGLRNPH